MRAKVLLKRVAIGLAIVVGVLLLAGGSVTSYFWIKDAPERAKAKREAREFLGDMTAEINGWNALKELDFTPSTLSLEGLEHKLNRPVVLKSTENTVTLGWICGGKQCAVFASFPAASEQEIHPDAVPMSLTIIRPPFASERTVGIAGIHVGETAEQVAGDLDKRHLILDRKGWTALEEGWKLHWGEMDGKINVLLLLNEKVIQEITQKKTQS